MKKTMMKNDFYLPDGCDWGYIVMDCSPPTGRTVDDPLPLPIGSEDFDIRGIAEYADGHFETYLKRGQLYSG